MQVMNYYRVFLMTANRLEILIPVGWALNTNNQFTTVITSATSEYILCM